MVRHAQPLGIRNFYSFSDQGTEGNHSFVLNRPDGNVFSGAEETRAALQRVATEVRQEPVFIAGLVGEDMSPHWVLYAIVRLEDGLLLYLWIRPIQKALEIVCSSVISEIRLISCAGYLPSRYCSASGFFFLFFIERERTKFLLE